MMNSPPQPTDPRGVWRQWNDALAAKLQAGGFDLEGQAWRLAEAVQGARARGDRQALWASLNGLCKMRLAQKQVPAARELADEALQLAEDIFGPRSAEAGTVISDLIFIWALQGQEHLTPPLVQRLIGIIMDQVSGELSHAFSYNLSSLATFFTVAGSDQQAENLLLRVIAKGEDHVEADPDLLLFVYDNLANFYQAKGEGAKAEQTKARALKVMERAGYNHSGKAGGGGGPAPGTPTIH